MPGNSAVRRGRFRAYRVWEVWGDPELPLVNVFSFVMMRVSGLGFGRGGYVWGLDVIICSGMRLKNFQWGDVGFQVGAEGLYFRV